MYCELCSQYIKVRKLFKGGNYSWAEIICGNTVYGPYKIESLNFIFKFGSDFFSEIPFFNHETSLFLKMTQFLTHVFVYSDVTLTQPSNRGRRILN